MTHLPSSASTDTARLALFEQELLQLRAENLLLRGVLDQLPDLIMVKDAHAQLAYANRAFSAYYGLSQALTSAGLSSASRQSVDEALHATNTDQRDLPTEQLAHQDGVGTHLHTVTSALRAADGTSVYTLAISREITAQQELIKAQRAFQAMVEAAPDAIISATNNAITYANPACRALFGYDEASWQGVNVADLLEPSSQVQLAEMGAALERGAPWQGTLTYRRQDSSTFLGQVTLFALSQVESSTEIPVLVGIIRDVTAQRAQEQRLELFEALTENALDGIAVARMDGVMTYANQAFRTMTGYGDQLIGMAFTDLYPPTMETQINTVATPAVIEHGRWQGELTAQRPDGSAWVTQMSAVLISGSDSTPQLGAIFRDVTAEKDAERERMALQEQIIQAQQVALRELSTPLIPLAEQIMVLPIVGSVDSNRAQQIMETLLEGVALHHAHTVLIDISGVQVVDTQVADALLRAAKAIRLLGAQAILTGISAEVAQTIVQLGADMSGLLTLATLQAGLKVAMAQTHAR
ncbi:PAS domain S-box protein [Candidatus Gracilibacteria bacterium]|nr:PAS domain S-box protein [Candidatus Gracilibacteria bacterium]